MASALLQSLASAAGLDPEYTSWRGQRCVASDASLLAALRTLAPTLEFELDSPDDAIVALAQLQRARWAERVPPVVHGWDGALTIPLAVPAEVDGDWELDVTSETGVHVHQAGRLFNLPADSHTWPDNVVHCIRRVHVPCAIGYHTVAWTVGGVSGESFGIAAPSKAYGGPGQGERRWGVFAPVYGLASPASGETGDLGTLRQLFEAVARRGGRYVATLPILAAGADQISPYSPVSRRFWNELYLDLGALAAEAGVAAPIAPPIAGGLIDYRAQHVWRDAAFGPIAAALLADPTRAAVIETWATANGTYDYAAFRAISEREGSRWRTWPEALRDRAPQIRTRADAIAVAGDAARVDLHAVAQYAMQHQLESLAAGPGGVALYLDLPVGVSCDAYEVWRHRDLFLTELAAGAPPDALFLGGQNWGLPPLSPIAARREHYRYFIACLRHHMKVAGMLRIDHVMGLFRLYCVPEGRPNTDGVYLRYAADELLAILTLESTRARCALVGEDLGTVPDNVRPAMAHHGLFRLHVGQWHLPTVVGKEPTRSPPGAVASLNTHDTATFAGWWRGGDIDDRRSLGLITDKQELAERKEREASRAALLAFVSKRLPSDDQLTDVERAMAAATADLAAGPAEVVLVALDDLALDPVPHNVPGTVTERTNWQRRVEHWADALDPDRASPVANATIAAVIAARR